MFYLDTLSYISFDDFDVVRNEFNEEERVHVLTFHLNESGTLKLKDMTERNLDKQIFLVVQNVIRSNGHVVEVISSGEIQLTGGTEMEYNDIFNYLTH